MVKSKCRMDAAEGSSRPETNAFDHWPVTHETATLLALLVGSDRPGEAEEVVRRARALWDDPDYTAALAAALEGEEPEA